MLKNFKVNPQQATGDILHEDGSKSYHNVRGGYIRIERPEVVKFIEDILNSGYAGWGYVSEVENAYKQGVITRDELNKIMIILD